MFSLLLFESRFESASPVGPWLPWKVSRLSSLAWLLRKEKFPALTESTPPTDPSGSPQASRSVRGHSLSSFPFILRVPFFIGGLLKSPALPEGLSLRQKGHWSEMASHMLAALPEFPSLATLCPRRAGRQPCYFHQPCPMWPAPGESAI